MSARLDFLDLGDDAPHAARLAALIAGLRLAHAHPEFGVSLSELANRLEAMLPAIERMEAALDDIVSDAAKAGPTLRKDGRYLVPVR